jgi:hypothetical protein
MYLGRFLYFFKEFKIKKIHLIISDLILIVKGKEPI